MHVEDDVARNGATPALDGRVVVITGASSGLGAQLARAVGGAGEIPVLAARRAERLEALTQEIANAIPSSATSPTSVTGSGSSRA